MAAPDAAAQDPQADGFAQTSDSNLRNSTCTSTSVPTGEPTPTRPKPDVLSPTATSSATTPLVSTPSPTASTPTATTTAGCVTLFTTPKGNSAGPFLHLGPDDNLYFPDGSNIVRMESRPPYTQTDFAIPGGGPFGITTGPDGNIWFTQLGQQFASATNPPGLVGRLLTRPPYTVTEFPLPGAIAKVFDIAVGGDGNLWFTRGGTGDDTGGVPEIDRILAHPPYTVTQFPLPPASPPLPTSGTLGPEVLTVDPQGNLWFDFISAGATVGEVGEISPFGSHEIKLFDAGAGPTGISVGPREDPNSVWFLGSVNAGFAGPFFIVRVDTLTHTVTHYPLTMSGVPTAIGAGPDGAMWVTEARTSYDIGRFDFRTHTFRELPLPDDTYAISPICGPDGNEWFSTNRFGVADNPQGNPAVIGRINLGRHDVDSRRFDDDRMCGRSDREGWGFLDNVFSLFDAR
ncbi:MAG: hypothetical protein JOZ65_03660 [Chloroflexi bacterium]|nr:hypothetical protein [Chloroflexota bacterium]